MSRPLFGELVRSELGLPGSVVRRALKRQRRRDSGRRLGEILLDLVPASDRARVSTGLQRVARMQEVFWPRPEPRPAPAAADFVAPAQDLVLSVRPFAADAGGKVGSLRWLVVPAGRRMRARHAGRRRRWLRALEQTSGEVLLFVPGFDNRRKRVLKRQRALQRRLHAQGFRGVLVGFDWKCGRRKGRLGGRTRARLAAASLATALATLRVATAARRVPLHVLAHSTGAFVLREAFRMAEQDDPAAWSVDEVVLCAADVDHRSFAGPESSGAALRRHCRRLTSYHSEHDAWLRTGRYRRPGVPPRLGRAGPTAPSTDVLRGIDCGDVHPAWARGGRQQDRGHTWYLQEPRLLRRLVENLGGR